MQITCPACGSIADNDTNFCRKCGADLRAAVQSGNSAGAAAGPQPGSAMGGQGVAPSPQPMAVMSGRPAAPGAQPAAPGAQPAVPGGRPAAPGGLYTPPSMGAPSAAVGALPALVCPKCNKPASFPGQKFCSEDGTPLVPLVNVTPPPEAKEKSFLDRIMGSTVDLSKVGAGFNPNDYRLETAGDAQMADAFGFFGKAYRPQQAKRVPYVPVVERRSEIVSETEARSQALRDFSKTSGEGAHFGSYAAQLSVEAMPTIDMVEGSRAKAAQKEAMDRLKHQVELGELTNAEAVELSEH